MALTHNWWAILARGIAAILFGIVAIFVPGAMLLTLVFLFAAYLPVDGLFAIVAAVRAIQKHERWGLLVTEGVFNRSLGSSDLVVARRRYLRVCDSHGLLGGHHGRLSGVDATTSALFGTLSCFVDNNEEDRDR
jgi:hypothetical protein